MNKTFGSFKTSWLQDFKNFLTNPETPVFNNSNRIGLQNLKSNGEYSPDILYFEIKHSIQEHSIQAESHLLTLRATDQKASQQEMQLYQHEEHLVHQDTRVHKKHYFFDNDLSVSPQNLKCV